MPRYLRATDHSIQVRVRNHFLLAKALIIYHLLEYKSCLQKDWRQYITLNNEKKKTDNHMKIFGRNRYYLERAKMMA